MIDLTRALYLGLAHGHAELAPWSALTTGRPSALDDAAGPLAAKLARLVGMPRGVLAPSTLHLVMDLYAALPVDTIYLDPCAYAITQWGLERAKLRGVEILPLGCEVRPRSAIICDAVCVVCRRIAPLRSLHALARRSESWLVVDDSQGLGLLGDGPSRRTPYGHGGGGTLRWTSTPRDRVIVLGSCAKAFGVPVSFLAGADKTIDWFERVSATRTHTSPCNAAELAALDVALRRNADAGDELRAHLLRNVQRFRREIALRGASLEAGRFPVQVSAPLPRRAARRLEATLARRGVRALRLRANRCENRLGFVITAAHETAAIDEAGAIVGDALARGTACWSS
ncbi:MAG: aminotransferase class I/II-fold pyridoxal phosphate-dependent enzyme [Myxococcota bacterium]|nr:pyridoxal phosphate-dependent aminotransferase family protein [Deltaproteobacteria bacterium]MDQ3336165.1 aminotransferase class I/II-fold pyridoxal phosphate-dependent enzyme [Myxococcota bacterium]